ncbi:sterol 3-beta-glucosyltransferase [Cladorrhinum samala]|uniref:Sterol 3-beta-glucosyltransferase n=1 Tax=Cladorrhinum samala TaxID=585594 RepID=A0AAV9HVU8_9PEZI|nr:sterol 3-beta-glucosyltransferase [Cladorrhinum samala]
MTEGSVPRRTNAVPIAEELDDNDTTPDAAPPPAYGDSLGQLQLSQAGFGADAEITSNGRINIHISEKNRRLSQLLAPAISRQSAPSPSGPLPPPYIPPSLGGKPGQTPPPRLNVVIQIVGSRGDVQPFIALGQVLRDTYGHRVRVATHPTFKKFVQENGLEFFDIGGDPAELMAFMVKHPGLMPGFDAIKSGEIKKRRQGIEEMLDGCWRSCIEAGDGTAGPTPRWGGRRGWESFIPPGGEERNKPFVADAIIANPPSFAHIHVAERLGVPLHIMFTMPWTATRAFPHPLADIVSTNADDVMTNYVSYALVEMMTWQGLGDVINRFRTDTLDLESMSLLWAPGLLARLRVPTTYCWSPALIPKPADWGREISVSGFYFLDLEGSYNPEPELKRFLEGGPPPVYIGFGSIVVDDPDALTRTILEAVERTGVRALVSKGWGGIGGDSLRVPENVFMLGNCPHDWLFKRVAAVVHHGGAGTTAAGIKAGKPTVVVPFFGDQIFWGTMIARAGAGPAPIPQKTLTSENLAAAIQEALKPETQARARELGEKIREEKGADEGGKCFHQFLDMDKLRCSFLSGRVAIWRLKRTQVRLSALAAAVLVKEGLLKYSDLKPYRSVEHNTEEQPWDPISAATAALVGDIGALGMAVADFPREVFKGATKGRKSRTNTATGDDGLLTPNPSSRRPSFSRSEAGSTASIPKTSTQSTAEVPPILESSQSSSKTQARSAPSDANEPPKSPSPSPVTLDLAVGAGKGVMRILGTSAKIHTNFCLGLARGFRNAPKLYNDEMVRPANEKVTSFSTGLKLAGKEFGLGMYDGVSGLITQPWKGAEKEGGVGLVKGFGKGIGGLMLKPAAGFWALPAYTFAGVQAEVRNKIMGKGMGGGVGDYIVASRVKEGDIEEGNAELTEKSEVINKWNKLQGSKELKGFAGLKKKEEKEAVEGNKLKKGMPGSASVSSIEGGLEVDDPEVEAAIKESIKQTSTGNREEDERIEAAVRASVLEMRRAAEQQQQQQPQDSAAEQFPFPVDIKKQSADDGYSDEDLRNITDEEYQALIEEAVRQSLLEYQQRQVFGQDLGGGHEQEVYRGIVDEKQRLKRKEVGSGVGEKGEKRSSLPAYEVHGDSTLPAYSPVAPGPPPSLPPRTPSHQTYGEHDEDEEQLRRAIEESEREHRNRSETMQRQQTEEEIVLNYVMKQSLAEEEYRNTLKGKGKQLDDDDEDEELKRALEMSLRSCNTRGGSGSHFGDEGPSGS